MTAAGVMISLRGQVRCFWCVSEGATRYESTYGSVELCDRCATWLCGAFVRVGNWSPNSQKGPFMVGLTPAQEEAIYKLYWLCEGSGRTRAGSFFPSRGPSSLGLLAPRVAASLADMGLVSFDKKTGAVKLMPRTVDMVERMLSYTTVRPVTLKGSV